MDIVNNESERWWKIRLACVALALGLALFFSAFFRHSNLFGIHGWMVRQARQGTGELFLSGVAILVAALLAKLIVSFWRKP